MNFQPYEEKLRALLAKGGVMFFTIERPSRLYRGMVLLSPVEGNYLKRAVYMKEYKCNDFPENKEV